MLTTNYKLLTTRLLKSWLVPVVISLGLFMIIRPALAQLNENQQELRGYLTENDLEVGSEVVDGYSQVYYLFNDEKVFITTGNQNNRLSATSGEYIAYVKDINEQGQIFLYNVLSGQSTQLTHSSINLEPKVDRNGWVVWEGWVYEDDGWQVYLFDGISVTQLTGGVLSMNPDIENGIVTYSQRDASGVWKAVLYSINEGKLVDVATGEKAREPKLKNGKVYLAAGIEEFPLTIDDLFILDLAPLGTSSEVTIDDVTQELEATASAEVEKLEIELSPTVSPAPPVPVATDEADLSDQPVTPNPPETLE